MLQTRAIGPRTGRRLPAHFNLIGILALLVAAIVALPVATVVAADAPPVLVELRAFQAVVTVDVAVLRATPSTRAARVGLTYQRRIVHVTGATVGEAVDGNPEWYRVGPDDAFISATLVAPFTPTTPPRTWPGRWIDIDLSTRYATAYDGDTPVYSALVNAGRQDRTPTGVFRIQRRVRSETMDSATVGFPPGHPEHYYLPNVEYTQYFAAGGFALHGNYWVAPDAFGRFSSNGCISMPNADAAWFWQFATVGTPVFIHG